MEINQEITNNELQLALNFVQLTNVNIFLTGKAGTGKTTFLRNLKSLLSKRMVVVAPTGVAAINAGGVTIHSFFQLHFGPHIPGSSSSLQEKGKPGLDRGFDNAQRFNKEKINIIRSLDLLIIDEISMVRSDVLDAIDEVLRRFKDRNKPFGGVQLLMIGDLQQLAPVVKEDEWEQLRSYYDNMFFFNSNALKKTQFVSIELKHIYRQSEETFISLLNKVRDNNIDSEALEALNKRYQPGFNKNAPEGYITLTTHNAQSQAINEEKLQKISMPAFKFVAKVQGEFPEYSYPTEYELRLKKGAQVMFVKNDMSRERLFYNGKIGVINEIEGDTVYVSCEGEEMPIPVIPTDWQNNKYTIDEQSKEITENVVGTFTQYPLKLAWAITIHKSQGLTFEKAIIDANAAFAHGQVYVALSRCKTFDGLVLSSPIAQSSIKSDLNVKGFSEEIVQKHPGEKELNDAKIAYQQSLLAEMFDFNGILWRTNYCLKLIRENTRILLPEFIQTYIDLGKVIKDELATVAAKFNAQLKQLLAEQPFVEGHEAVQQRIMQASKWFADKMEKEVCLVLQSTEIETDNSNLKKQLKEAIGNFYQEAFVMTACYQACQTGFSVKNYCEIKAKASIEKLQIKAEIKKISVNSSTAGSANPLLFKTLKIWRDVLAEKQDVPVYRIIPQKTMFDIVDTLPQNSRDLEKIKGMGKKKMAMFGDKILDIVRNYIEIQENDRIKKT
ncbi:MAG: HRDC domain-containing protein [Bacteroidota bacterium]